MNPLRRLVISSAALAPLGCATATFDRALPVATPKLIPGVRQPQIGQQWTYLKINPFTSKVIDVITERVEIVGQRITISRCNQNGGTLASEIQGPWGTIITDPHWGRTVNFSPAIPFWPEQMQSSWNKQFWTRYSVSGFPDNSFTWQQYMYCAGWEKIKVPAGEITCLRYQNLILFQSDDLNRYDSTRHEVIWFAPEIGRWVARESSGSYMVGGVGGVYMESSNVWQLSAWK